MGLLYPFIEDKDVKMYCVEAAGLGLDTDKHSATISKGTIGVIHGMMTYLLQDEEGEIMPVYSIAPGLYYPGVGPEHAYFYDTGRINYVAIKDDEAVEAFKYLTQVEGIIPAIESSHAVAYLMKMIHKTDKDDIIIVNLSGRGDKDIYTIKQLLEQ